MYVASDSINGFGTFSWETTGDEGAIEVPDYIGHDLISRPGGHYWSMDGTQPIPVPEKEPDPIIDIQDDESMGDDLADAIGAAKVGPKPRARTHKSTAKE